MADLIDRQAAIDALGKAPECKVRIIKTYAEGRNDQWFDDVTKLSLLPSAQPEDYTELKREFIRMAEYVDMFLKCSDEQKETLIGFILRLAEYMPWTERD